MIKKLLFGLSLLTGASSFAGGFQLNTQSVRALGMGGSNTAWAIDASAVYFNPAAITRLSGYQFSLGVHYVTPSISLQTEANDNINQTTGNANPIYFYYTGKITEKMSVGFLVNNQFGSSSSFEDSWEGRNIVQNISLRTFMFQPTLAYQIHEKLSIGAGFVLATGSFSFEKAVPVSSTENLYGKARLAGKGTTYGGNFGIHFEALKTDKMDLSIGLDYRTALKLKLDGGTAEFSDIPSSLTNTFPESTTFKGGLTLPSVASAGLKFGYKINDDIDLSFVYDFNYTSWSSYDTLAFDFENADTPDSKTVKNWQNVSAHRFGVDLTWKEKIGVRGGLVIDQSPILDGYLSPELPDHDQVVYSAGLSYQINDMISVDLSYLRQNLDFESSLDAASFSAKYHRIINVYGFGVNVKLGGGEVNKEPIEEAK